MKFVLVLLAVLGLACAKPAPRSLSSDVDEFLALIPKEELIALYHKYENDPEVQKVVAYLKSGDFGKVVHIVAGVDEVKSLVNFLESKGVAVIDLLNRIADRLGLPHWPGSYQGYGVKSTRGWRDLVEEAKALLPLDDIIALAIDKLANSADFQELYERIANVDYQKLHDQALSHPEIKDMIDRLKALGVDVSKIWEFLKTIFGWNYALPHVRKTRSLSSDVDEFLALIPKEELIALYHKYENDPEVQKVVAYLKSGDFGKVVHIVAGVDEVKSLVNFLESKGVAVIDLLNRIADRLGLPHWPGSYQGYGVKSTRGWRDLVEEAKALLPLDDIIALAIDKLANSADFQELYERIANVDYQKLHDQALSHPEIKDMIDRLKALGVDVSKIWEFLKTIFGWNYALPHVRKTRSLSSDVDEFLALIPKEELIALYHKYENDPEVQKVVAYLKSGDFGKVVHIVAGVDEVKSLVNFLESKGVAVIDLLNRIADRLGLPHWPGSYQGYGVKSTRGWRDLVEEAKALLPLDDIIALAIDKLANSADFQELYERIANVDYQKLHDQALSHPEIKDMIDRLKALGVDVSKIWEFLKTIFGWNYALPHVRKTRSLSSDVDEFLALIPKEELIALYHKYENDPEVQKVVAYLKSGDFGKVVHIVAGVDEVKSLVNFLESKGVAVIDLLNRIADRLGLPHWPGSYQGYGVKSTRGWRDLVEEAKALLPLDDIIALAIDKLANSADFQELYERIANVDYQKLHDQALSHPEIKDMIDRLKALGVDVSKIWEFLKTIFGWNYALPHVRKTRSLSSDVDEFLALIPKEELIALYHKYENDPEVQKVVAYLKSGDFGKVVHIVAGVDEVKSLVNFLESKGVAVIDLLNRIADRLGLPHWPGSYQGYGVKSTRGWRDLVEEAKALLPLDDIIALAIDKLANSADFQELYERIANVDYQKLHDQALSHPEIKDMVDRLKALGVDVSKIWEFIKTIFGWNYAVPHVRRTRSLSSDLDEFLALIPKEDFVKLYHKYENDPDVKKVVAYLKSEDFAKVVHIVAGVDEVKSLVNWLESKGIAVIDLLNRIADRLGLPHWPGSYQGYGVKSTRAWRDLLEEAKALLPLDDIVALAIDKLANSADFQELYERIANVDYQKLHNQALSHPEIQDMISRLEAMGVNVSKIIEVIKAIFGWE